MSHKSTAFNSYLRMRDIPHVSRWLAFKCVYIKGTRFNYDHYYAQWSFIKARI